MTVTIYTTPNCPQCMMTKKFLDRRATPYFAVDLATNKAARTLVMDTLGYRAAPVVTITNKTGDIIQHFNGFRPDLLAEYAPTTEGAAA